MMRAELEALPAALLGGASGASAAAPSPHRPRPPHQHLQRLVVSGETLSQVVPTGGLGTHCDW